MKRSTILLALVLWYRPYLIEGIVLMVLNKASRTDVGTYYGYYAVDEAI